MRSEKNRKLLDEACRIGKAMDVQLVTRGMQPHSVVILGGTPEQSVHDVRAELLAHDARWSLGDQDDPTEAQLPCVEAALGMEELAKRCVLAAAERQGVTVAPGVVGMLRKGLLRTVWKIDSRFVLRWTASRECDEVIMVAAGEAWSIGESHMEEMDTDFTAVDGDTKVLPLRVLSDAMQQKDAYRALYREHIALGVLWIPQIRGRVAERLGREPTTREYATRVKEALGMSEGAWKGIHRLAEHDVSALFRMISALEVVDQAVIWSLAEAVNRAFANGLGWRMDDEDVTGCLGEFLRVLKENTAEGVERVLRARRGEEGYLVALGDAMLAAGEIVAAERCCEATMYGAGDDEEEVGLMGRRNQSLMDWLAEDVFVNPRAILRGYRDVVKGLRGAERVERLAGWARRKQQRWHRDVQERLRREDVAVAKESVWSRHDEPVEARTDRFEVPRVMGEGQTAWAVQEICTSTELKEEAKAMVHCVFSYEPKCVAGRSRIFSLRDSQGRRVSTIELKRKRSGEWALAQHRGVCNAKPHASANRAVEAWLVGMNHREKRA